MGKAAKQNRTVARRLKGFRDITAADLLARDRMITRIREVYERYGFTPLETPALEYADVLGKFLPDADRPDAGIFSFRDEDDEWIALRYDLTAPLSRYVAMNPNLPRPFRRYQVGPVYRVEKPGPDRFREFYQSDFDSVGTNSMLADAECCMVMCDTLSALGIAAGEYIIRVNDRKVLNGVLEKVAAAKTMPEATSLNILRSIDKLDRVGLVGVRELLGPGRRDESGDFTRGLGLEPDQIDLLMAYLDISTASRRGVCDELETIVRDSEVGREGVGELREIDQALTDAGYGEDRVIIDPTVVRGLAYYTGPVFEGVLTFDIVDDKGITRQFGSVFGGGRYDDLVERFTGQKMPATGASIGVDRLLAALRTLGKIDTQGTTAPVLVTRLDKSLNAQYQQMAAELRDAGINAELYVGNQGIGKQFKYASDSGKTVALVMGSDEMEKGEVSIKDLRLGDELSKEVGNDRRKWLEEQPAQFTAKRADLVKAVNDVLARYATT
ncbi:MAG: histidine--tRNA ligase [Phycisphaerales bacterium]|nr:MAG: histidine--tRNA ligase [Phycisphaerales bacterium]